MRFINFLVVLFLLVSCSDKSTNVNNEMNPIVGLWVKDSITDECQYVLSFFPNGTFSNTRYNCSTAGFTDGTYSITGNEIFLENPASCVVKGEYQISIANKKLTITLVKDSCGRKDIIPGVYTLK